MARLKLRAVRVRRPALSPTLSPAPAIHPFSYHLFPSKGSCRASYPSGTMPLNLYVCRLPRLEEGTAETPTCHLRRLKKEDRLISECFPK